MNKKTRKENDPSRVTFEGLEQFARQEIQKRLQELLEEEVAEFPGRTRSERRTTIDAPRVYRQEELEKRFESRLLPLFVKRTQEVQNAIPDLYLHGLAEADFDLALRGLPGDNAPLSASTLARLKDKWKLEWEEWKQRPLPNDVVYMWVDGVYVREIESSIAGGARRHERWTKGDTVCGGRASGIDGVLVGGAARLKSARHELPQACSW